MIEFALLFGLGFLSALLIGMLIAPAIHRRIVSFTENRIRATVPISPQEVRAQRDMARALYAAENARTKQDLQQERDKALALKLSGENFQEEIRTLTADNIEMRAKLESMDIDSMELRSQLRQEDNYIADIKAALDVSEESGVTKDLEIERLRQEIDVLAANNDNARIDLSTRETEIENLKFRVSALREERDGLRQDVRLQTTRAKDAETRLAQEEHRTMRLEDKLAKEVSLRTDRETTLERRGQEIERLREKMKVRSKPAVAPAAIPALIEVGPRQMQQDADVEKTTTASNTQTSPADTVGLIEGGEMVSAVDVNKLASDAKTRAMALAERLLKAKTSVNDDVLRQEMATIAAEMVAMTALSEGAKSPVHAMIAGKSAVGTERSLAARVRLLLATAGTSSAR